MASLNVLLICGFLPGILSQCTLERAQPFLKRSVYEFAIELTTRIAVDKENHFIASTLSVWSILLSAWLGADGVTRMELQNVLKLHHHRCFNDRFFEVIQSVIANDISVTMERSSNIFVDEKLGLTSHFQTKIKKAGITNVDTLPFDNPEIIAEGINDYVARATYNMILDIVVPSDLDDVNLVMVDAIYFQGLWQIPFPYENTQVKPFHNHLGAHTGDVNMMSLSGTFNMSYVSQINAQVLELPYGADGRFSMLVVLPDRGCSLSELLDYLKRIRLTKIYKTYETVTVELPRFKVSSDLNILKDFLIDMGVRSAFDSKQAEFPFISSNYVYISNFVQKANIRLNEEGSIASAATKAGFSARSRFERFRADRPFFYMTVDKLTEIILFTGAYSKPSLY